MASYDSKDLVVLEGLDAVRMRPGMYIGTTGVKGLHHLLWEIIDNSIDEVANGYGNKVEVTLHKDGTASVLDNETITRLGLDLNNFSNGQVAFATSKVGLIIKACDGFVKLIDIQPEGGKRMDSKSYLNGKKIEVGSILSWTRN